MVKSYIRVLLVVPIITWCLNLEATNRLVLGGNFNEHSEMIRWELLERSKTRLIRGFIPASPFLREQRDLGTDPAVQNLKKAVADGYKVILCLKWDFKARNWRVPEPGSKLEQDCFFWVDDLIEEIGDVFILETINEVMVDTHEQDVIADNSGTIPMVVFQNRLVDHLFEKGMSPPPVYMGGFTRLYDDRIRSHPVTDVMLKWIHTDKRISGASFHVHTREMEGFEQSLKYIRKQIPQKPMIVTEFSLVWKYKLAMKFPIGRFAKGKQFAEKYQCNPDMLVRDYINSAIDNPVAQPVWMDFLNSQYWYEPDFLEEACTIMDKYGVTYAAYAFQQGSSGQGKLGPNTNPWILNPLYLPSTAVGENGGTAVNQDFMRAYRNWR